MTEAEVMSDLHLDFPAARGFPPLAGDAELVLIAGDTCEGLVRAVEAMRMAYPNENPSFNLAFNIEVDA
jgi:hypothetical protein